MPVLGGPLSSLVGVGMELSFAAAIFTSPETCRDLGFVEQQKKRWPACIAFSPVVLILRLLASATHPFHLLLSSFFLLPAGSSDHVCTLLHYPVRDNDIELLWVISILLLL